MVSEVHQLDCRLLHNLRTERLEHMDVHQLQQLYGGVSTSLHGCRQMGLMPVQWLPVKHMRAKSFLVGDRRPSWQLHPASYFQHAANLGDLYLATRHRRLGAFCSSHTFPVSALVLQPLLQACLNLKPPKVITALLRGLGNHKRAGQQAQAACSACCLLWNPHCN